MPKQRMHFRSATAAIATAATASAVVTIALLVQPRLASARADTPQESSSKAAVMKRAACGIAKKADSTDSVQGKPIVVRGTLIDGGKFTTAKWHGSVVVVDFWATWCPWCRAEMPGIEKLYQRYHGQGLEIIGVPLSDTAAAVRSYLKANPKVVWPQIFDKGAGNTTLAQELGVSAFPAQCVIDRRGILKCTVVGSSSKQLGADVRKLDSDVRKLIQKADGGS